MLTVCQHRGVSPNTHAYSGRHGDDGRLCLGMAGTWEPLGFPFNLSVILKTRYSEIKQANTISPSHQSAIYTMAGLHDEECKRRKKHS